MSKIIQFITGGVFALTLANPAVTHAEDKKQEPAAVSKPPQKKAKKSASTPHVFSPSPQLIEEMDRRFVLSAVQASENTNLPVPIRVSFLLEAIKHSPQEVQDAYKTATAGENPEMNAVLLRGILPSAKTPAPSADKKP